MINLIKWTLLVFLFMSSIRASGQIDISESLADPKSLEFKNLDLSVSNYLDSIIHLDTSCCEDINLILKVQYDKTGTVTYVEPMSTSRSCAVVLITEKAYGIRWDAQSYIDSKTIYLEINHESRCD